MEINICSNGKMECFDIIIKTTEVVNNYDEILLRKVLKGDLDLFTMVSYIRTVLRNYHEEELKINIINEQEQITFIALNSTIKTLDVIIISDITKAHLYYEDNKIPKYDIAFSENTKLDETLSLNLSTINNRVDLFLKNVMAINKRIERTKAFNEKELMIIGLYQIFFNETPDFSKDENIKKVYSMLSILNENGISIPDAKYFSVCNNHFVVNQELSDTIKGFIPYGPINQTGKVDINSDDLKTIKVIKIIIDKYYETVKEKVSYEELLSAICYVEYISTYCLNMNENPADYICTRGDTLKDQELVNDIYYFIGRLRVSINDRKPLIKYEEITKKKNMLKLTFK